MHPWKSVGRLSAPLAFGLVLFAAGPSLAQMAVNVAPGVFKAPDFTPPLDHYVAAADTPIFTTLNMFGPSKGAVKLGEKLDVLAEAQDHNWLLLGQGGVGVGVGYVPRSLATPAKYFAQMAGGKSS